MSNPNAVSPPEVRGSSGLPIRDRRGFFAYAAVVVAGAFTAASAPHEVLAYEDAPDYIDLETRMETAEIGPEGLDLTQERWRVAGVEQVGTGLLVKPVGLAVKDKGEYVNHLPFNLDRRLNVEGDYQLSADIAVGAGGSLAFTVGNKPVSVYDSFLMQREPAVSVECTALGFVVKHWDGVYQQPVIQEYRFPEPVANHSVTLEKHGDQTFVRVNDMRLEVTDLPGKYLWTSLTSKGENGVVGNMVARPLNGGRMWLEKLDTMQVIKNHQDGLADIASATRPGMLFGTSTSVNELMSDPKLRNLIVSHCNLITDENAAKPNNTHPLPGIFTFERLRTLIDFAERHGLTVHGHTLIPHRHLPQHIEEMPTDTPEQREAVRREFIAMIQEPIKAAPEIRTWDLFNELFDDKKMPGGSWEVFWRDTVFYRAMGEQMISIGVQAAKEADPDIKVGINEFAIDKVGPRDEARSIFLLDVIKRANRVGASTGATVDYIGAECHMYNHPDDLTDPRALRNLAERAAAQGLGIRVSEIDVTTWMNKKGPTTPRSLAMQGHAFGSAAAAAVLIPNCGQYNTWGIGGPLSTSSIGPDKKLRRRSNAMWDENYQKRPAYSIIRGWLRDPTQQGIR